MSCGIGRYGPQGTRPDNSEQSARTSGAASRMSGVGPAKAIGLSEGASA